MVTHRETLASLREDVEALLEDLVADEADHNLAALWVGEQLNQVLLQPQAMRADPILIETMACLLDLVPRLVPIEVKPGTFEKMLKRLREFPAAPPPARRAGR